jgi:hypothetical protein
MSICIPEDKRSEVALDVVGDCVRAFDCKGCIAELAGAFDCKGCIVELAGVVVDELAIADEATGVDPLQVLPAEVNRTATRKAVPFTSDLKSSGAWKHKKQMLSQTPIQTSTASANPNTLQS